MRPGLPILTVHALERERSVIATDPAWFATCLAALHEAGFQAVDLAAWIDAGRPEVERGFALTFDDGLASLQLAAPLVARYGFRATAFLVTNRMGQDNSWPGQPAGIPRRAILSWRDAASLRSAGFSFGSHTSSHANLKRLPRENLGSELRDSRAEIEDRLGAACKLLAYPYGASSARVRTAAGECYSAALGTRLAYAHASEDAFDLSRIDFYYLKTESDLASLIAGSWPARLKLRNRLRQARRLALGLVS